MARLALQKSSTVLIDGQSTITEDVGCSRTGRSPTMCANRNIKAETVIKQLPLRTKALDSSPMNPLLGYRLLWYLQSTTHDEHLVPIQNNPRRLSELMESNSRRNPFDVKASWSEWNSRSKALPEKFARNIKRLKFADPAKTSMKS